jgi:hypothetical protein
MKKQTKKGTTKRISFTRFSKDDQPTKRRGKGIITRLNEALEIDLKDKIRLELSAKDMVNIQHLLLETSETKLDKVKDDKDILMLARITAKRLLNSKYGVVMMDKIIDRKLKQSETESNSSNELIIKYMEEDDGLPEM